jgi:hypothetical protein
MISNSERQGHGRGKATAIEGGESSDVNMMFENT